MFRSALVNRLEHLIVVPVDWGPEQFLTESCRPVEKERWKPLDRVLERPLQPYWPVVAVVAAAAVVVVAAVVASMEPIPIPINYQHILLTFFCILYIFKHSFIRQSLCHIIALKIE